MELDTLFIRGFMIGTLLDCQIIMNLLLSEIPFRIIAIEIERSQAWGTIAK